MIEAARDLLLEDELREDIKHAKRERTLRIVIPQIKERIQSFYEVNLSRQKTALKWIKNRINELNLPEFEADYERIVRINVRAKRVKHLEKFIQLCAKNASQKFYPKLLEAKAEAEKERFTELFESLDEALKLCSPAEAEPKDLPENVVPFIVSGAVKVAAKVLKTVRQATVSTASRCVNWMRRTTQNLHRKRPDIHVPKPTSMRVSRLVFYDTAHLPHGPDP